MFPGNNGGGPRPLSKKKTVQFLILLTLLAWATQTLFHQWGYGQAVEAQPSTESDEKFVPGSSRFATGATLEMRAEATVVGTEVKLKQVCRWSDSDASVFAPIADLTLIRLGQRVPFRSISVDDIRTTLRDAGVNIAAINFVGSTACTVARSDVEFSEGEALQKWIDAREPNAAPTEAEPAAQTIAATPATQPTVEPLAAELAPYHNLRDLLTQDLSVRLGIPIETLQMSFSPQDERLLNLSEPHFKFQIDPQRARNLGEVSWNVTIFATDNTRQRATVGATARAWQNQLVITKPMGAKQLITDADVIQRRTLVDRLLDDTVLDKPQAVGQQASRDLKPGTVLTARLVDAVQLVRPGQFVTVMFQQGSVELKTVARALDGGSYGQTIRVKNETTRDIFNVILTGPQTASMTSPVPRASENPNIASARE